MDTIRRRNSTRISREGRKVCIVNQLTILTVVLRPSIAPSGSTASGGSSASLTQRGFRLKAGEYLGKVTN